MKPIKNGAFPWAHVFYRNGSYWSDCSALNYVFPKALYFSLALQKHIKLYFLFLNIFGHSKKDSPYSFLGLEYLNFLLSIEVGVIFLKKDDTYP